MIMHMNIKNKLTAIAVALFAGFAGATTLTWNGGASGNWGDEEANWLDESNNAVAWTDGADAAFTSACDITLAKDVTVASLSIKGGDFNLYGQDVLAFSGDAKVSLGGVTANIACPVYANGTLTTERLNTQTTLTDASLSGNYVSSNDWTKIYGNEVEFSKVQGLSFTDRCLGWISAYNSGAGEWKGDPDNAHTKQYTVSTEVINQCHGARVYDKNENSFKVLVLHGYMTYGGTLAAMEIGVERRTDGIYAKVLRNKAIGVTENKSLVSTAIYKSYDELDSYSIYDRLGEFLIFDSKWELNMRPSWKGKNAGEEAMYAGAMGCFNAFSLIVSNPNSLTFSGNILTAGDMTLVANVPVTFAGHLADTTSAGVSDAAAAIAYAKSSDFAAVFNKKLTSSDPDTTLAMRGQEFQNYVKTLASGAIKVSKGAEISLSISNTENYGQNHSALWRISGTVDVKTASGFSQAATADAPYSEVLSGGKMVLSWGATNPMLVGDNRTKSQPVYVRDGGLVVVESASSRVESQLLKTIVVEKGGVYSNAFVSAGSDGSKSADNSRPAMIDLRGGRVEGYSFWFGWGSYAWGVADDVLSVSGTEPSTMAADYFMIYGRTINTGFVGGIIDVADVTGDDESDLIVECPIQRVSGVAVTEQARWGYGIIKAGAGTMELRKVSTFGLLSDGTFGGTTMLSNGTIRIAKSLTDNYLGRLHLGGDAALQLDDGATVNFASSTNVYVYAKDASTPYLFSWNPDATLTLKSKLERKSIRFGTDASGLTADQLAQIKYASSVTGKKRVAFSLDADGYLQDDLGKALIIVIE
jgi:hypothetical protein